MHDEINNKEYKNMYVEVMQISIAASMIVQTGLMVRSALRTEQSQSAGVPKVAPELKIETAHHSKEAIAPAQNTGNVPEVKTTEPSAGDIGPVG